MDFYYSIGFDVIDYVVFNVKEFYVDHTDEICIRCEGWTIKPDGMNEWNNMMAYKLWNFFRFYYDGSIKTLSPEKYAKILLEYGS